MKYINKLLLMLLISIFLLHCIPTFSLATDNWDTMK